MEDRQPKIGTGRRWFSSLVTRVNGADHSCCPTLTSVDVELRFFVWLGVRTDDNLLLFLAEMSLERGKYDTWSGLNS